jgi:signal transduction histidine kinase
MTEQLADDIQHLILELRTRLIRNALIIVFAVLLVFAAKGILIGSVVRVSILTFAMFALALAYHYNRSGGINVALVLMLTGFWACIVTGVLTVGSAESILSAWFPILVTSAGLLGGRRHCLFWLVVSGLTLLVVWMMELVGVDLTLLTQQENEAIQMRMHLLAQLSVVGTLMLSFVAMRRRYEAQLMTQMESMAREVQKRRRAEEDAVASNHAKTLFLANMSHEIRTPLNSIIGFSSRLMKRQSFADPKDADAIECVHRNGKGLLYLVNELLELASIEANHLQYTAKAFSADNLIHECLASVEPVARSFGLRLDYKCVDDAELRADRARLHQVLASLLYFGIRQTREGGIELTLSRSAKADAPGVQICVADTSPGIAEEQLVGLFETHYQLVLNSNRDLPISALTLALAAKLVQMHGGDIKAHSTWGQGTRFLIWLPLEPPAPQT